MTTISWSNSFFTDTTVAMLIKHNNYTKLERTENYNHSLELTVICGMYMGIIKENSNNILMNKCQLLTVRQHAGHFLSAPHSIRNQSHPFFIDVLQSLSISTDIHTEVYSFFLNRSLQFFIPGFHSLVVCTWIDCFVSGHLCMPYFGPPPMRPSV